MLRTNSAWLVLATFFVLFASCSLLRPAGSSVGPTLATTPAFADTAADSLGADDETPLPASSPAPLFLLTAPVPPPPGSSAAASRRYVRQAAAFSRIVAATHQPPVGPRKVKVTGSSVYAAPGATLTAAIGKNAAGAAPAGVAVSSSKGGPVVPVVGDGNVVEQPPIVAPTPSPWWALVALAGIGLYLSLRNRS